MSSLQTTSATIPAHVPPEIVFPYDFAYGPEVAVNPPGGLDAVRDERRVIYSTAQHGGFWMFTRYDDIRAVFQNPELFEQIPGAPQVPFPRRFIPLHINPPDHAGWRRIMTELFSPRHIALQETAIRGVARGRLKELKPTGRMDFAPDFALALPAAMYCVQMGIPLEEFPRLNDLVFEFTYEPNRIAKERGLEAGRAAMAAATAKIDALVDGLVTERRAKPGDDVLSILFASEVQGRAVTDAEAHNMAGTLFFAGVDSTAGAISYAFAFLARYPQYRQQILDRLDDPEFIWNASEELIRFHGFHNLNRRVTRDVEFAGVKFRKGDLIVLPLGSANRDGSRFPDPLTVDFERKNARSHLTFGAGIHRCIGSHLATLQMRIALEEFHRAIPDYRLAGEVVLTSAGPKITPSSVPFEFTPG